MSQNYLKLLKTFKFIAKPNTWFVEGTEATLDIKAVFPMYITESRRINSLTGIFQGYTNETYQDYIGELPRLDGEACTFDEFLIYDKLGNEVSELTFKEYQEVIKR